MILKVRRRIKLVLLVAAVIVAVLVAVAVWWFSQQCDSPAAVDLQSAVAVASGESTDAGASQTGVTEPAPGYTPPSSERDTAEPETAGTQDATSDAGTTQPVNADAGTQVSLEPAGNGFAGEWFVEGSGEIVELTEQPAVSFAGYRVDEVLAGGVGAFTAVGRTADVSGSIELSDTALVAAEVRVNMSTLRTDNGMRDNAVRRALNTGEFPFSTFVLTEPVPIDTLDGLQATARGELTVKGVTQPTDIDLEAQLVNDTIVVVGSTIVVFDDYGVRVPDVPVVVSAEDRGVMEFQLFFTR